MSVGVCALMFLLNLPLFTRPAVLDYPAAPLPRDVASFEPVLICFAKHGDNCNIVISPDSSEAEAVMSSVVPLGYPRRFFPTEGSAMNYIEENTDSVWASVAFHNDALTNFTIGMNGTYLPATSQGGFMDGFAELFNDAADESAFTTSGFLTLQHAISMAIINTISPTELDVTFLSQKMPTEEVKITLNSVPLMYIMVPVTYLYGFIPLLIIPVVTLVGEVSSGLKNGMKLAGLSETAYWGSWFISLAVIYSVYVAAMSLAPVFWNVYPKSDVSIIFILLELLGVNLVSVAILIASVVKSTTIGGASGLIFIFGFQQMAFFLLSASYSLSFVYALWSPAAFSFAMVELVRRELTGDGAKWSTIASGDRPIIGYMFMLIFDTFLYLGIAALLSPPGRAAMKGARGRIQSLWKREADAKGETTPLMNTQVHLSEEEEASGRFEAVPAALINEGASVTVRELVKQYAPHLPPAVNKSSFDLYRGQCFALLGHNGAGKSTTISCLTGLLPATSGEMIIDGHRVGTSGQANLVGVCPQDSILFDKLTPREHLTIYAHLRGITDDPSEWGVTAKVHEHLRLCGLEDKADCLVKTLSGGMKRKLSLGLALIGEPPLVLLDEPSSGMDPTSRHQMWDLLLHVKKTRTLLLTTHYMEEADALGDRIAIMNRGVIRCCGSSSFLKDQFGVGYYLSVACGEGTAEQVTKVVTQSVASAAVQRQFSTELTYMLPSESSPQFPDLFEALDAARETSLLESYGLTTTSLEDVFIRVTRDDVEGGVGDPAAGLLHGRATDNNERHLPKPIDMTRPKRFWPHFRAMVSRNVKAVFRSSSRWTSQLVIPFLLFTILYLAYVNSGIFGSGITAEVTAISLEDSLVAESSARQTQLPFSDMSHATYIPELLSFVTSTYSVTDLNLTERQSSFAHILKDTPGEFLTAMEYNGTLNYTMTFFHNDSSSFSLPATLNAVDNFFFYTAAPDRPVEERTIHVAARPFPGTSIADQIQDQQTNDPSQAVGWPLFTAVIIGLIMTARDIVHEKELGIRHQMTLMGLRRSAMWLARFAVDFTMLLTVGLGALIVLAANRDDNILTGTSFIPLLMLMMMTYIGMITQTYLLTCFFKTSGSATKWIAAINFLAAYAPNLLVTSITMANPSAQWAQEASPFMMSINPGSAFIGGIGDIRNVIVGSSGFRPEDVTVGDYFAWESNLIKRLMMDAILIIAYVVMFLVFDRTKKRPAILGASITGPPLTDEDVLAEAARVREAGTNIPEESLIHALELHKFYGGSPVVDQLNLSIKRGECFGLLGPNGAGKTTTISMLTGLVLPNGGAGFIQGRHMAADSEAVFADTQLGVCAQFDGLWPELTAREHLYVYSAIRDWYADNEVDALVDSVLERAQLVPYADRAVSTYSGGNRRKLNVAIAALLDSRVMFLDEPSCGLDPATRRVLWDVISGLSRDHSVVLTTHSMEEAEALCTRLAIIVRGQLKCLGSPQHLKSKFGGDYLLAITARPGTDQDKLKEYLDSVFPTGAHLMSAYGQQLTYALGRLGVSLPEAFRAMESGRTEQGIDSYSFQQTTLDQVFLLFASQQEASLDNV